MSGQPDTMSTSPKPNRASAGPMQPSTQSASGRPPYRVRPCPAHRAALPRPPPRLLVPLGLHRPDPTETPCPRPPPSRPLCSPGTTATAAPALARAGRGQARPLRGLAVGGHAAADHGRGREGLLRALPRALARRGGTGGGPARGGAEGMGRPRLLRPRPQPSRLRGRRGGAPRRPLPIGPRRSCAPCPASATTRRRRWRRSLSARPRRSSTATSSAW